MIFFILSSYAAGISSVSFGAFVYFKNPRGAVNRSFLFLALMVAVWSIGIANEVSSIDAKSAVLWLRGFHVGVCFIPVAFFHFASNVIDLYGRNKKYIFLFYIKAILPYFFQISFLQDVCNCHTSSERCPRLL